MSDSRDGDTVTDNTESGNDNQKCRFEMPLCLKEKLKNIPEALEYIKLLEKHIRKQKRKLKKIKAKFKDLAAFNELIKTGKQLERVNPPRFRNFPDIPRSLNDIKTRFTNVYHHKKLAKQNW